MLSFIARRLMLAIPVLFGLLVLTFVLVRLVPSDPAAALAGEMGSVEMIEAIRKEYGFDRPIVEQFFIYLGQVVQGNLGISYATRRPVMSDVIDRLPATIELTLFAISLAAFLGITIGVIAAEYHGRWIDLAIRVCTIGGLAIASFWMAIMLQFLFSMELDLLPVHGRLTSTTIPPPSVTGMYLLDSLIVGRLDIFIDALRHIILPGVTLAIGPTATIGRFTRSGVLDALQKDYVTYETAVGYPRMVIMSKYVLRNSVITTVTQIGLLLGGVLSSAVVIEAIFDWPGLGSYAVTSIFASDYQAILAATLVIGVAYAVINLAVDIVHALIDPRVMEQL